MLLNRQRLNRRKLLLSRPIIIEDLNLQKKFHTVVYNGNLNKSGTTTYPLWKNPQQSRTISTVTHFPNDPVNYEPTFQTFVDDSQTPAKTIVEDAWPDDTFNMTDWSYREGSVYIKGIRFSAQTQAPVNSEIAKIDSLQLIERGSEYDIVDEAIDMLKMSTITDTPEAVVSNLKDLPSTLAGANITWMSNNLNLISNDGKLVDSPAFTTNVIMTAKITNPTDGYTKYMDFTLTVPPIKGFVETYSGEFAGTASSAGSEGTKNFEQLPMWEFTYPGISNGTNGEVHTAQVLEKNNYLVFKKISDRQTPNYQECLVGMRSLSNDEKNPLFTAATIRFTAKVYGTGTMRFAPMTIDGNMVCTLILDASTKHIEIVYGEEKNGIVAKVIQRIDSIDPTIEHDYVLELREDHTFSVYVDGEIKLTEGNVSKRKFFPEAGINPILTKLKTWITNITFANTEVGNLKSLNVYNVVKSQDSVMNVMLSAEKDQHYMINVTGKNISSFKNRVLKLLYDPQVLAVSDLIGESYEKELTAESRYGNIRILSSTPGRIEFVFDKKIEEGKVFSGLINSVIWKAIKSGDTMLTLLAD